jgi:hypothetical protein
MEVADGGAALVVDTGLAEHGASLDSGLPICPPEIMWYDCPQPKCDCQGRKAP